MELDGGQLGELQVVLVVVVAVVPKMAVL